MRALVRGNREDRSAGRRLAPRSLVLFLLTWCALLPLLVYASSPEPATLVPCAYDPADDDVIDVLAAVVDQSLASSLDGVGINHQYCPPTTTAILPNSPRPL